LGSEDLFLAGRGEEFRCVKTIADISIHEGWFESKIILGSRPRVRRLGQIQMVFFLYERDKKREVLFRMLYERVILPCCDATRVSVIIGW